MGENPIVEIAQRLDAGETVKDLRDMRGVAYVCGAKDASVPEDALNCPVSKQVRDDKLAFAEATKIIHNETNPYNAKRLMQKHGDSDGRCQSTAVSDQPSGDGSNLRLALHAATPSQLHRTDSGVRDDQGFGHDHARLLWRLHVLFDHRPPGPNHSVTQQGVGR